MATTTEGSIPVPPSVVEVVLEEEDILLVVAETPSAASRPGEVLHHPVELASAPQ